MCCVKSVRKIRIDCELEVEINKKWLGRIQTRLLDQVERPTLLNKEIVVKMINKLRILIVLDEPTSLQSPHTTEGSFLRMTLATLVII
jgi:hypothetical protein